MGVKIVLILGAASMLLGVGLTFAGLQVLWQQMKRRS